MYEMYDINVLQGHKIVSFILIAFIESNCEDTNYFHSIDGPDI